jgi:hypothetical protein
VRKPRDDEAAQEIEMERKREEMEKEIKMIGETVEELKLAIKPEVINKLVAEEVQKLKNETNKQDEILNHLKKIAETLKIEVKEGNDNKSDNSGE